MKVSIQKKILIFVPIVLISLALLAYLSYQSSKQATERQADEIKQTTSRFTSLASENQKVMFSVETLRYKCIQRWRCEGYFTNCGDFRRNSCRN
ncbi:hypothetical protein SAMN05421839_11737 [Halolactibacillus halophilus]|uniref:Uncharacterized protein n=1 Tax=Halolactibacillus halophilus TaxID=306540 RepID=A0A1I5PXL7_9BACI|nr:hypothetical protein HHA03_17860 [Halolactibacillus halophilus]SFP38858.1 hypothetical protein SAMN05421839_11737 [Halolactibacillus halophilus]